MNERDNAAPGPLRKIAFGALGVILALVVGIGLLEVGLRVYCAVKPNVDVEFFRYANLMKGNVKGAGVGFMHRPNTKRTLFGVDVEINSRGFRDVESPREKPEGSARIALLGDSVTFGWGVPYGERFSEIIEQKWTNAGSRTFDVINTGHGNYNTVQEYEILSRFLADEPLDGIVQVWYINDAELRPEHRDPPWYSHLYVAIFFWSKSDLLQRRFGNRETYVEYYQGLYQEGAPGLEAFEEAVASVGRWAEEKGLPWVFVVLPEFHDFRADSPFTGIYERVGDLAAESGAFVIDATHRFRGHDPSQMWVAYNDVHPNSLGHTLIASTILDFVAPTFFPDEASRKAGNP